MRKFLQPVFVYGVVPDPQLTTSVSSAIFKAAYTRATGFIYLLRTVWHTYISQNSEIVDSKFSRPGHLSSDSSLDEVMFFVLDLRNFLFVHLSVRIPRITAAMVSVTTRVGQSQSLERFELQSRDV
ncbi:hypothetical protein PG993_011854 [Apiospora rasikravindrae]|uniref:Uncharacterized protein n=1 Tax=Apiospora rasikravindrae TaxID=990691 RepID=A0ABR1S0Y7_9PEZI